MEKYATGKRGRRGRYVWLSLNYEHLFLLGSIDRHRYGTLVSVLSVGIMAGSLMAASALSLTGQGRIGALLALFGLTCAGLTGLLILTLRAKGHRHDQADPDGHQAAASA